ncbi:MAG TPA: hypothetical protein VGY98_04685 [Verrucomicrobiae bacterium]|nr:hypothetical protein [Verrucomicrobiae bacterium]
MKKFLYPAGAGLLCWLFVTMNLNASTLLFFSVNMATNLANGTFNPPPPAGTGTNAVYANGTFYGWSGSGLQLVQEGGTTIWTNSYNDTSDQNGKVVSYRFDINGSYESTASWDNRGAELPATSGASLVLPTPYYGDVGPGQIINVTFQVDMSEEIELGHFIPGADQLDVRGSFNGWGNAGDYLTNNPAIVVTNYPTGIVESNVYVGTFPITTGAEVSGVPATNAFMEWKAVEDPAGSWESPGSADANDAGNRFFTDNTNQALPVVSFSDLIYAPLANVTLNVDMSGPIKYDPNYLPNSVTVWGSFNNWASGVSMTAGAAPHTNVFSATVSMPENSAVIIQVRYTNTVVAANNPAAPWVYDYLNDAVYNNNARRTVTIPFTASAFSTNLPVFNFLDLALDDYLPQNTPVLFAVNMANAVGTDGHVFSPGADGVYINGMFANGGGTPYPQSWYAWSGGVNPVSAPAGYQMIEEGTSSIYTNTIIIPAGTPIALSYQYGMDPGQINGGPLEDESPSGANHFRVVRTTAAGTYAMPTDVFTNLPYVEPLFAPGNIYENMGTLSGGDLSVGTESGGNVPVSWLGRPGAHLQSATSVNGPWTDIPATDGTTWTNGVNTANGLLSETNWPAGNQLTLFRLIKP